MRITKSEREKAQQIAAAVDELVRDPHCSPDLSASVDTSLLAVAQRLACLPALMESVDPLLEQMVVRRVRSQVRSAGGVRGFRLGWAATGLFAILLVLVVLTPVGQTAVASFMTVFSLGQTEVRITPVGTPGVLPTTAQTATIQHHDSLESAQSQFSFLISKPDHVPSGYQFQGVNSYTYSELPAWVPQPLLAELVYENEKAEQLTLRIYPIMLGSEASIARMDLQAAPIQDVVDVDVNGQPGVLLQLGRGRAEAVWREVVWEQDDLILALAATDLSQEDLLRVAESVR